ncbi:hypothetical protein [Lacticaseibacillus suibinensis]|uniref:hypothetical protein n=1 Tax=Lacticaseibacillus suibinensis TaxID=2486011 RepID=UPI000F784FF8|nr:hypothetical protein [Lacticaseibacillus suibinensis]
MIVKNLKRYVSPDQRSDRENGLTVKLFSTHAFQESGFFNTIFQCAHVGDVLERRFIITLDDEPKSIIESYIPCLFIGQRSNCANSLERDLDKEYSSTCIERELLLTWPTGTEAESLRLIGDSRVIVEKQSVIYNGGILRYEQEISDPEFYEFKN